MKDNNTQLYHLWLFLIFFISNRTKQYKEVKKLIKRKTINRITNILCSELKGTPNALPGKKASLFQEKSLRKRFHRTIEVITVKDMTNIHVKPFYGISSRCKRINKFQEFFLPKIRRCRRPNVTQEVDLTSTSSDTIFANSQATFTQQTSETVYDSRILNTTQCSCDQKLDKLPNTQD